MPQFSGFPKATHQFLRELAANNERDWFKENKSRYESDVLDPALDFITTMGPKIATISDHFEAVPKRVGGSLMRVYRDTRFSKDKTPYKTNIGIQFRHELGKDVHAPGYYMHIEPDGCFFGVGMWHPEPKALAKVRAHIHEHSAAWQKAIGGKAFKSTFELSGDSLKRPPKGYAADAPCIEDLKRKDFIAVADFPASQATHASFVNDVTKTFKKASPFMKFLCDAVEVPF